MKYWGPINSAGGINGNDGYVDGNPGASSEGSIPTFHGFEQTLRELQNLTVKAGLTPDSVLDGVQIAQAVQSQKLNWALDTGTANALSVILDPVPASLAAGLVVRVLKIASANTTTTPTLNVNGFGPQLIVDRRGNALVPGDLPANGALVFLYDGTNFRYMGVVAADFGGLKAPFNIQQQSTVTRVRYNAITGFQTIFTGNYTKLSPTSDLTVRFSTNLFSDSPPSGSAAAVIRVTFTFSGSQVLEAVAHNGTIPVSSPACTAERIWSGLPDGTFAWTFAIGRNDGASWYSTINPNSAGDVAYLPNATSTYFVFQESEP